MAGNVCEWCWDRNGLYSSGSANNPKGPDLELYRIVRGGSWQYIAIFMRCSFRGHNKPSLSDYCHGFRCVTRAD